MQDIVDEGLASLDRHSGPHRLAAKRLERLLDGASPPYLEALCRVDLRVGAELLVPDVVVAASAVLTGPDPFVEPADVTLVAEILNRYDSATARVVRARSYAEAGIRYYVEVDLVDGPRVTVHELRGGEYLEVSDVRAGDRLCLPDPFEASFDPGDLVGPWR